MSQMSGIVCRFHFMFCNSTSYKKCPPTRFCKQELDLEKKKTFVLLTPCMFNG